MDLLRNKNKPRRNDQEAHEHYHKHYSDEMKGKILLQWHGPEYENYPKDRRWYMIASFLLIAVVAYALITNSPLMAITFILIGIVGFVHLEKDPRVCTYSITKNEIIAEREVYDFEDIKSFWIIYKEPHQRILSLHTDGMLIPYVHIPIHEKDPEDVRELLRQFVLEKKQQPSVIDTLERLLHI